MSRPFPKTLQRFRELFPNDAACARLVETARWPDGFTCAKCGTDAEPFRFAARPNILRCRSCEQDTWLMAGTVMGRSHLSLTTWFQAAFLVLTENASAMDLRRELRLTRYDTAHKLLARLTADGNGVHDMAALLKMLGVGVSEALPSLLASTDHLPDHAPR